jgi:hypothetical protein
MTKILFNKLDGEQCLEQVLDGGSVRPDCEILWDERVHGPMPAIELGKMEAYDELESRIGIDGNVMYKPLFNEDGDVVVVERLDENGEVMRLPDGDPIIDIVYSNEPIQISVRKLRIKTDTLPAHAAVLVARNQLKQNIEAKEYLAKTDWYIIRELDSGIPCPADIRQLRQAARNNIVE